MLSKMISVCILAKNSAQTIETTLASVALFPEVILLDNGSTDETLLLARRFPNVKIYERPFIGFGPLRNEAASFASHDWIFALDTDETISPALLEELTILVLDPLSAYSIPRHNYYNGKHIKGCGWFPDRVIRLYHRGRTRYSNANVHESVILQGLSSILLKSPILHTPFRSTAEFLTKMQFYSTLFAKQRAHKQISSPLKAFLHSLFTFFRCYFFQRGFLLGSEGFIVSLYNSNSTFYKYVKLWEENHDKI